MSKNVVWWIGIKNPSLSEKYGGFDYFEYSRKSWEYWCKKNDVLFVPFEKPVKEDLHRYRVNWQKAMYVFDELDRMEINYDQIALIDSSAVIKWDAPNFFEMTDNRFTAWVDNDNLGWISQSIDGYKPYFNDYGLDISKYISSGFMVFNEQHREFFESFKKLYLDNIDSFIEAQDSVVKKGTEQTPINYWLQMQNVDVNLDLPLAFKLTHLHRKDMFSHNWQLNEDKTPFFIKYGYVWFFNGIAKNERTNLMSQVWDLIKVNYE
jgi:hypothetical protein